MGRTTNLASIGVVTVKVMAAGMLLWAMGRHRYDYYILLRWIVCGVAAFSAFRVSEVKRIGWAWALAVVALLFNPIIPVHLTRQTWGFIEVATALLLLVSIVAVDLRPPSTPSSNSGTIQPRQRGDHRVE